MNDVATMNDMSFSSDMNVDVTKSINLMKLKQRNERKEAKVREGGC